MAKSKSMGWSKIRYTNDKVPKYRAWNPAGFGCTAGCDGCWACGLSKRLGKDACPQCKAFVPHLHAERLSQPADTKIPGVVLVNFTCDTFDNGRKSMDYYYMQHAATLQHNYVWLTKNPRVAQDEWRLEEFTNHWLGLSLCNQEQADAKLPTFLQIPGQLWLSLEPLWGPVDLDGVYCIGECDDDGHPLSNLSGVIVGHDNRPNAPGTDTLAHVRSVVEQCKAAGVPVFVKQLHLWKCRCGKAYETRRPSYCTKCLAHLPRNRKLCHDPADFPEDLRHRDLPWSMPT